MATGSSWTQIGATVAGTTSALYNSTGVIGICRDRQGGDIFCGLVYQVEIRASIAATDTITSAAQVGKSSGVVQPAAAP